VRVMSGAHLCIAVYGMSHHQEIGEGHWEKCTGLIIRDVTAREPLPSWSLVHIRCKKQGGVWDVAVMGIMSDSVGWF